MLSSSTKERQQEDKMDHNLFPFMMLMFSLLSIANGAMTNPSVNATQNHDVYIVYLGEKPHEDHVRIVESHYDILANVVGSKEEAQKLILYNYKYIFSGFAAKLTKNQAKKITSVRGVRKVWPDSYHKLQNTRSWNSLGLSPDKKHNDNLLQETNMGDGIIIGVIDSGISDSKAFSDEGLGPIPSHWKGNCKTEGNFNASKHCNKKVIGARSYAKGLMEMLAAQRVPKDELLKVDTSPLDKNGHGTHVASTVAGSFVHNVTYHGFNLGTFRGGAPRARLAVYKACHKHGICASSDVVAAVDEAVQDGVDVLQISSGSMFPVPSEVAEDGSVAMSTFHAVARGVAVVVSAGNDGPTTSSASEVVPWTISVAASTIDRAFATPITLGDNQTLTGRGIVVGKGVGFSSLFFDYITKNGPWKTLGKETRRSGIKGNVVISYFNDNLNYTGDSALTKEIANLGGLGLVISRPIQDVGYQVYDAFKGPNNSIPVVEIDYEAGNQIFEYMVKCNASKVNASVMIGTTNVLEGEPLSPKVASYSSRGPSVLHPEILKPDIAAPGSNILAAVPPTYSGPSDNGFAFMSGTSMAAPHISAIVALLKAKHRDWSPAALRSALVTTALNSESYMETQIMAEGFSAKPANPFDFGGGIVNPNTAEEPGLVYDMNKDDYLNYLCSQVNFPVPTSPNVMNGLTFCQNRSISLLDLNLPSITIPSLQKSTTIRRTITNVGPPNSVYRVAVKSPPGTSVSVEPNELKFESKMKQLAFSVTVTTTQQKLNTGYTFGSLTWSDGKHFVRSPISVKTDILHLY